MVGARKRPGSYTMLLFLKKISLLEKAPSLFHLLLYHQQQELIWFNTTSIQSESNKNVAVNQNSLPISFTNSPIHHVLASIFMIVACLC